MTRKREYELYRLVCLHIGLPRPMSRAEYKRTENLFLSGEDEYIIKTIRALAEAEVIK